MQMKGRALSTGQYPWVQAHQVTNDSGKMKMKGLSGGEESSKVLKSVILVAYLNPTPYLFFLFLARCTLRASC